MAIRASYAQVPTCVLGCPASEARRAVDVLDGIARPRGWSSLLLRVFASGILLQGCCFGVIASGTQNATRVLGCPASEARLGVDVLERHHGLARHRTATRVSRPPSMAKQKPLKQKREAETQTGEAETRVVKSSQVKSSQVQKWRLRRRRLRGAPPARGIGRARFCATCWDL